MTQILPRKIRLLTFGGGVPYRPNSVEMTITERDFIYQKEVHAMESNLHKSEDFRPADDFNRSHYDFLVDIVTVANYLHMNLLLDLTYKAIAKELMEIEFTIIPIN